MTINSPPKVNFTVISDGAVVTGLTASNVSVIIAKLVPGTNGTPDQWQSYTSKTETATATVGPGGKPVLASATQATTDPKQTDATLLAAQLTYNSAGYYTYTFSTDIKDPTKTNGVVYDPTAIHRVAIQLSYTNKAGNTVLVNPYFDFTIDANGNAVAVTDTSKGHKAVDITSCNQCHEKLAVHGGGRVDTAYCVLCHNAGTTDANSGNVLDFRTMVHKIHDGDNLNSLFGINYTIWGYKDSQNSFADVGFPQDVRNCTKCHDNTKAPQADNWKNVPSRAACGTCHAGIDFSKGTGLTIADAESNSVNTTAVTSSTYGHVGGIQTDDSNCHLCHGPTAIPVYHQTQLASPLNPTTKDSAASFTYKISKVTIGSDRVVSADFQVLKNGTPVTFNAKGSTQMLTGFSGNGPSFVIAYSTGQDGIANPSDWNSGHSAMTIKDAWNGVNGNTLTLKDASTSTYTAYIKAASATTSLVLPADAKMVTAVLKDGWTQDGVYTDATKNATDPTKRVALTVSGIPDMMAASGNTPDGQPNVARRVIFKEGACNTCHERLGTGNISSSTGTLFHTGNYSIAMCAVCHTPNTVDSSGWAASSKAWIHAIHGSSKRTVPFTATGTATSNFSTIGYPGVLKNCETCHLPGTYDFSASQYTANNNALVNNMLYITAARGTPAASVSAPQTGAVGSGTYAYGASYGCGTTPSKSCSLTVGSGNFGAAVSWGTSGAAVGTVTTDANNLVTSPIAGACTSCHDDINAITHITTSGFGSFYAPRGAATTAGVATAAPANTAYATKEQCLVCHGVGKILPIKDVHNPATAPW